MLLKFLALDHTYYNFFNVCFVSGLRCSRQPMGQSLARWRSLRTSKRTKRTKEKKETKRMTGHGRNRLVNLNIRSSVVTLWQIWRTLKAPKIGRKLFSLTILFRMALQYDLLITLFIFCYLTTPYCTPFI